MVKPGTLVSCCAGIAHLLEHMAFKGSPRIGTKDFAKEAPILQALDEGKFTMGKRKLSITALLCTCSTSTVLSILGTADQDLFLHVWH